MSKIGKLPIDVPGNVTVQIKGGTVRVNGPKGELSFGIPADIAVDVDGGKVVVSVKKYSLDRTSALFGLTRATIANMVRGVAEGFVKKLELSGVGYRAQVTGGDLVLFVGFTHSVTVKAVSGIAYTVSENVITVSGADKGLVGEVAARIRAIRPPEPYKGKGIAYVGEYIRRKAGKAAKTVGTK